MNPSPNARQQLQTYVRTLVKQRIDGQTIRTKLLEAGWDNAVIEKAISQERGRRTRNAVLWILSPIAVFIIEGVITSIAAASNRTPSAAVNIVVLLMNLAGGVLFFVGPIMGIITLSRR